MKINKKLVSLILSFVVLLGMFSASAVEIGDNTNIAGAYGNRAIVIGKADAYAGKIVTLMLSKNSDAEILYMDTILADSEGYYEFKMYYNGFQFENGRVSNCTLKVRAGDEDITDTILSATVNKTDLLAIDLKTSLGENEATAVANINNLYGLSLDSVIMIAAYDKNNRLVGVTKAEKEISEETDEITVIHKDVPAEYARLVAYVWDSTASLIPYAEQKEVEYAQNNIWAVVMHPGSDESEKRFAWYNDQMTIGARIQYALKADYEADGGFTDENSKIVTGTTEIPHGNKEDVSCKAEINGLTLGTEYVYRLGNKYHFADEVYSFKTYDPENSDKQVFVMVSDLHNEAYTVNSVSESKYVNMYNNIFGSIKAQYPDIQFIASTGDNVSQGNMGNQFRDYMNSDWEIYRQKAELEMGILFAPDVFKEIPWASALGNHEANNTGREFGSVTRWHYNLPNDDGITGTYYSSEMGAPNTHGNFWFRNGDVLVIGINSVKHTDDVFKYSQSENNAKYIQSAIEQNEGAKWKILINHVPSYSFIGGNDEQALLRERFADMDIDQYDFDVVFTGHSHSYSRSKQLLTDDETSYTEVTDSSGATTKHIKPEVVSEDIITHSDDGEGHQVDTVTDPEGAVHINLPSLSFAGGGEVLPDYADYIEAMAPSSLTGNKFGHTGATVTDERMVAYSGSAYVAVTIEKTEAGQQMKLELVLSNANSSATSDNGTVLDTYIINKTLAD